jgi:hypothetical protein
MNRSSFGFASGAVLAMLAMTACTPTSPAGGEGVGFTDYNSYIRGAQPGPAGALPPPPPTTTFDPAAAAAALDRADGVVPPTAVLPLETDSTVRPRGGAPAGIKEESGEVSNVGISDEQDFEAVKSRESIESDAERIARNRSEYVIVQPKDLPVRAGDTGPNIVEFALATTHAPGVQMFKRSGIGLRDANAACAKYASPDKAQQEFLAKGGPERDRLGVDPDGDGFACSWDPRPFRTALN